MCGRCVWRFPRRGGRPRRCGRDHYRSGERVTVPPRTHRRAPVLRSEVQAAEAQAWPAVDRGHHGGGQDHASPEGRRSRHSPGRCRRQRHRRLPVRTRGRHGDQRRRRSRRRPRPHRRQQRHLHRHDPDHAQRWPGQRHPVRRLRSGEAYGRRRERHDHRRQGQRSGVDGCRRRHLRLEPRRRQ